MREGLPILRLIQHHARDRLVWPTNGVAFVDQHAGDNLSIINLLSLRPRTGGTATATFGPPVPVRVACITVGDAGESKRVK